MDAPTASRGNFQGSSLQEGVEDRNQMQNITDPNETVMGQVHEVVERIVEVVTAVILQS